MTPEYREFLRNVHLGKTISDENIEKLRVRVTGEGNPMYGRTGELNPTSKLILQLTTGVFFYSIKEAAVAIGMNYRTLKTQLSKGLSSYGDLVLADTYEKEGVPIKKDKIFNLLIDDATGIIYNSIKDAVPVSGVCYDTLIKYINGVYPNLTTIRKL
jgi:hypothetical protein